MNKLNYANSTCLPSLKLLGDFWTLRIIDALSEGDLRYCELQRRVDNLNPVTFTNRLRKLEAAGLIKRIEQPKAGVSYKLSSLGVDILPVLSAIDKFSSRAKTVSS